MKKAMQIEVKGFEVVEKTAKLSGNGAQIYVPKKWAGKKVTVILTEPNEQETINEQQQTIKELEKKLKQFQGGRR